MKCSQGHEMSFYSADPTFHDTRPKSTFVFDHNVLCLKVASINL